MMTPRLQSTLKPNLVLSQYHCLLDVSIVNSSGKTLFEKSDIDDFYSIIKLFYVAHLNQIQCYSRKMQLDAG